MKNEVEITYDEFEKYLKEIESIMRLTDALIDIEVNFHDKAKDKEFSLWFPTMVDSVITLLAKVFDDKEKWIDYWVWELDCGKEYKDGMVTERDGSNIPLKTPSDLWNLLMRNLDDTTVCEHYKEVDEKRRVGTFCYPVRAGKCVFGNESRNCFCKGNKDRCDMKRVP